MGQSKNQIKYRDGDSSSGNYLSTVAGTISTPIWFLPYAVGVFSLAFLASCITASIMTPVQNSDATTGINLETSAVQYYVNIASNNGSGGTISKDIQATYAGTIGVITDTLKIKSNTPNGYYVYVSAANGYNQNLTNTSDSSYYLSPIDTSTYSVSNPGTLSTENTWGVAVGNTYNANYDAASNYTDATVSQSTKFGPVPAYGSEELLITRTGSTVVSGAESDTSLATVDTIPVYYGYLANSALPSGTYANTVLYTAYAEATDTAGGIAKYTGDIDYVNGGTATFTTSLYTDREVSVSDVSLTVGGTAATVTSVSKVDAGNNDSVVVVATLPAQAKPGNYDAVLTISKFGHSSTTSIAYDTPGIVIESGEYAGTYKTMQDMTTNICAAWDDTPTATVSDAVRTYSYGNGVTETQIQENPTSTDYWNTTVAGAAQMTNINSSVPEVYLKDERDSNYYRIRKLADGNCWMTENLRLTWEAGDTVATQNGTWTPTNSTILGDGTTSPGEDWGYNDTSHDSEMPSDVASGSTNTKKNWRTSYSDRSAKAGTRTVNTLDGEAQEIGVWYNWYAATAGTGTWDMTSGEEASDSICPSGWQLPVVNSGNKSWYNLLYTTYGGSDLNIGDRRVATLDSSTTAKTPAYKDYHTYALTNAMRRAPLSLPFTGDVDYTNDNIYHVGSGGYWWSSTAHSNTVARNLTFYSGYFSPQATNGKGFGFAVRCVAQ